MLGALAAPPPDYNHEQKGDALYSMEIALALEKLNFQMLYSLHETADKAGDAQMTDFVEEMLAEQVCPDWPVCARHSRAESSMMRILYIFFRLDAVALLPVLGPCCNLLRSAIYLRGHVLQTLGLTKN